MKMLNNITYTSYLMLRFYSKYYASNNGRFRNLCSFTNRKCIHSCSKHKIGDDFASKNVIDEVHLGSNSSIAESKQTHLLAGNDGEASENTCENKKKVSRTRFNKAVNDFIDSKETLRPMKSLLQASLTEQASSGPYLCDEIVASDICQTIQGSMTSKDIPVIELNPGVGFLTEQIIEAGISDLRLFESSAHFYSHLKQKFPSLKIQRKNVSRLWKLQYLDEMDGGTRISDIFYGIKAKTWDEDPAYCLISAIENNDFVKTFVNSIMLMDNFFSLGKPECFLIIDPLSYLRLINKGDLGYRTYTSLSVLFQTVFDCEVLLKIPRNVFLPYKKLKINQKSASSKKLAKEEGDLMYLIKLTARKETAEMHDLKYLGSFHYFISQLFSVKNTRLIPFLEQWIPGCGPKLISKGYDVYTLSGELKPEEAYNIFMELCVHFGNQSPFYSGMENMIDKSSNDEIYDYEELDD